MGVNVIIMKKNVRKKRIKNGKVERRMSLALTNPACFSATTKRNTSYENSSKFEDSCWEQLFAMGDEMQKEAQFTVQDHKNIIAKVRRTKKCE